MAVSTFDRLVIFFKGDRFSLQDCNRPGRPVVSASDGNIATIVRAMVDQICIHTIS